MVGDGRRWALPSFVASAVLAGGNGVGIRFSNRELAPLWGASLRFGLAALVLLMIMAMLRLPMPRGRAWAGPFVYGLLTFAVGFGLAYYALQYMHAGFGQTLLAMVPLVTLLLAVLERQEKLRLIAVAGTLLSLAGILVMSRAPLDEPIPALAILAALGSVVCMAQTAVLVHRLPNAHPVTTNAIGMGIGALVLLAASALTGEAWHAPQLTATWVALAYLVLVGSVAVFVLYIVVLRYWPASRAAYLFVLIPFVTLLLSARLDNEPLHAGVLAGGLLVLAGVYIGALRRADRTPDAVTQGRWRPRRRSGTGL
jgi:drug/metabolite transporter (DMT)-like permease